MKLSCLKWSGVHLSKPGVTTPSTRKSRSKAAMATQQPQDDANAERPNTTSPGNEGARGSRGAANSGAQEGNSTNQSPLPEPAPDLREADARGGGGAGSESSRSK
jgi:hypothetical protein